MQAVLGYTYANKGSAAFAKRSVQLCDATVVSSVGMDVEIGGNSGRDCEDMEIRKGSL